MSNKGFQSMEFWKAMEKGKEEGPPASNAKARPVPKTPKADAESAKRTYQSQTLTNMGSAGEDTQLRKPMKKWTSLNAHPPSNGPGRSRSRPPLRTHSMSVFESSATWYTDDLAPNQEDKRRSVEVSLPPREKKQPHWCSETASPSINAPTVSVTAADSSVEERRGPQSVGPSLLTTASGGHGVRRALTPPPKPPPPSAHLIVRARRNRDTPSNKTLGGTSLSAKHLSTQTLSPDWNTSMLDGPTLTPSRSMENLKNPSPSPLSLSPTPNSYSHLHITDMYAQTELHSPTHLLSPVSPMDSLFVTTAAQDSLEEMAFSALLRRVLQDGNKVVPSNGQVPSSAPPRIHLPASSSSSNSLPAVHNRHGTPSPTRVSPAFRLSRDELCVIMSSFYSKLDRFKFYVKEGGSQSTDSTSTYVLGSVGHLESILHCTKVLCHSLLEVLPPSINTAVLSLKRSAEKYIQSNASVGDPLLSCLEKLQKSVEQFVADYCSYFHVGYQLRDHLLEEEAERLKPRLETPKVSAPLKVYVGSICRLPKTINSGHFSLHVSVCCGEVLLTRKRLSLVGKVDNEGLIPCILFNQWLDLSIPLSHLPLESRLVFALLHEGQSPSSHEPLACGTVCIFQPDRDFWSGTHLLCLWPGGMYKYMCAGVVSPCAAESGSIALYMRIDNCGLNQPVCYSDPLLPAISSRQTDLGLELIQQLTAIVSKERFTALTKSERDLLWESRHQLSRANITSHHTVPMLVRAMPGNSPSYRAELYAILDDWRVGDTLDALALLTPNFPDSRVRGFAAQCLYRLSDEEVTTFLPQIVQSLKCDWLDSSPTAEFLLVRAKASKEIAHHLYWTLHHVTEDPVYAPRYRRLWSALIKVLQKEQAEDLRRQDLLVESLVEVAGKVKEAKDKKAVLLQELKEVERLLKRESSLPLDPAVRVRGLTYDKCSFFSSFTVPLKLSFKCGEGRPDVGVIFKAGDDLRQDMIAMQMICLFDDMWKKAGLDLNMITYGVVATGQDTGMLEFVGGCETLREIQTTQGVTGSFKDHILADWLMRHNPTKTAYSQAVETFTASCAGYCVASYVLGIGDRHNDNIMVTTSGHMFHIDYGKILGHAQMFGNIKRDRAPFVFTPDMAYVINGGGDKGTNFQHFTDLCCTAYQELRGHTNLIINLLELMLPSGLPELSSLEDIQYVSQALLPGVSAQRASSRFTRLIEDSLSSVSTQINFVIHNLGQRKSGSKVVEDLLTFVPGRFTFSSDGAITRVEVTGFQKRIRPEKYYDYKVVVERDGGKKETIYRRYREFHEFNEKLKEACPGVQLPSLPEKLLFQRSHVQQVSEQRQVLLNQYIQEVMLLPPAVSQCDLVYTFLHRMVRDEHDLEKEEVIEGGAEVKLDMKYNRTHNQVTITVMHAKNLPQPTSAKGPPDPYVKLYVTPDLHKKSKQRSKVVESTHNPTYNETFFYPVGQDGVDSYTLQVSVWTKSILGGKECLGQTEIKLHLLQLLGGVTKWYKLSGDAKVVSLWSSTHPT